MERVTSIPVGVRVYLERQLQAGTQEARFLQGTYSHPLGHRLSLEHALRTGTALFRGRLDGVEPGFLVVRLDEAPEAITVLFTSGLEIGLRADDGKAILTAQVMVVGSTLDGEVFVRPPAEVTRIVQRAYQRGQVYLPLDLAGARCQVVNLSGSGLLAICPADIPVRASDEVLGVLHLPHDAPLDLRLRAVRLDRSPYESVQIGLMFLGITEENRDRIIAFVMSEELARQRLRLD